MAQSQLVEAAQAMRKMKQHVEQLARTKRHYESTIKDMSEKLTKAEKANLELRNRKPEKSASDLASADELAASRKEVRTTEKPPGCSTTAACVYLGLISLHVLTIRLWMHRMLHSDRHFERQTRQDGGELSTRLG